MHECASIECFLDCFDDVAANAYCLCPGHEVNLKAQAGKEVSAEHVPGQQLVKVDIRKCNIEFSWAESKRVGSQTW